MKRKWDSKPIGEICHLINGRAFKPSNWGTDGLRIVRIQNLNDPSKPFNLFNGKVLDKHTIDNGTVLLSWSGTPGTSFGCFIWNSGRAILNQHIFKVDVNHEIMIDDFFMYAIKSQLDEMIRQAHGGVGLRHITKKKLENMRIPIPSLSEQRRIVARIKECLDRVDEIKNLKEKSLNDAKRLLDSYYHETISDLKNYITIGEVIIQTQNGRSIRQSNENPNGRTLTLSAVHDVELNLQQFKNVVLTNDVIEKFSLKKNDVFISRSNTIDLVGLSSISEEDSKVNLIYPDLLIKLVPDTNKILPRYLTYALRYPYSRQQIRSKARGSSQSMVKISGSSLKEILIPLPSLIDQEKLVQRFDKFRILVNTLKMTFLETNFDSLKEAILQKAFSGEL